MDIELIVDGQPPGGALSWRQHVHAELTRDRGTGDARVPGRSRHEPFRVTRRPDHLSPELLHAASSGTRYAHVQVVVHRDGQPILQFVLHDVLVISVLSSLEDDGPIETIDLSYGSVDWTWLPEGTTRSWSVFPDSARERP